MPAQLNGGAVRFLCACALAVLATLALVCGPARAFEPPVALVFFHTGETVPAGSGADDIRSGVNFALAHGFTQAVVTGHTDAAEAGSDEASIALSLRRAAAVRDLMVSAGFDASRITIKGEGFHQPLVPTDVGVAEPQNRRVNLVFDPAGSVPAPEN